jgi:hypothetical protein
VWNADLRIVAHLNTGYALELLEHLQGSEAWKTIGLVIGSPDCPIIWQSYKTLFQVSPTAC